MVQRKGMCKKVKSKVVGYLHVITGWLVFFWAQVDSYFGAILLERSSDDARPVWVAIFIIEGIIFIILEIIFYRQSYLKIIKKDFRQHHLISNESQKIFTIDEFQSTSEDQNLALVDDYVFNFTEWVKGGGHPGGPELIKESISKDMGRYLNGSATEMVHNSIGLFRNHSPSAYLDLKNFLVGKLLNQQFTYVNYVGLKKENESFEGADLLKNEFIIFDELQSYKLASKFQITKSIIQLTFEPLNGQVVNDIRQLKENWLMDCGKHFKVVFTSQYVSEKIGNVNERFNSSNQYQYRFYSLQRTLNPVNKQILEAQTYKDNKEKKPNSKFVDKNYDASIQKQNYNYLDMYIKIYYQNGFMSQLMDKISQGEQIKMSLPIGAGLMLTHEFFQKNPNPNLYAFCGGTAINAFIDLAYYTFYQKLNPQVKYKIKFTLFAGFQNEEECYALSTLQQIQHYNPDDFKFVLYFSKKETEIEKRYTQRFDKDFVNQNINPSQVSRVYIRGPLQFEHAIRKAVKEIGIPTTSIIML